MQNNNVFEIISCYLMYLICLYLSFHLSCIPLRNCLRASHSSPTVPTPTQLERTPVRTAKRKPNPPPPPRRRPPFSPGPLRRSALVSGRRPRPLPRPPGGVGAPPAPASFLLPAVEAFARTNVLFARARAAERASSILPPRKKSSLVVAIRLLPSAGIRVAWSGDPSRIGVHFFSWNLFTGIGGWDYCIKIEGELIKHTCNRPMTPKWSECPSNSYRELSPDENENKDGNVYKRRKLDKDSNSLAVDKEVKDMTTQSCTTSEEHSSLLLPVVPPDATFSNLTAGKIDPILELEEPTGVSLEPHSGVNDRYSMSSMPLSSMMPDKKDAAEYSSSNISPTEPITELTSARDLCIAILRKDGLITESRTRITSEESTDCDANRLLACYTCGSLEHPLKMLICDSCEAAFHLSCHIPCIKELPADEWYCLPCLRKKPKSLYGKLLEGKVMSSGNMNQRPHGMSHIEYMFKDTESYVTGVRIGRDFQAEVPEWSGPTFSSDGYFEAPSEFDPAEIAKMNWWKTNNLNRSSTSTGNWVQCREVLSTGDSDKPVICGKWRRAPLYVVQSDDWDCSCCLPWDPVHADCAVPQELDTGEVLTQLKYVNVLKNRLVDRNHKPA